MYGRLFRRLPGPMWLRIALSTLLLAVAVLLLMQVVFPWMDELLPTNESVVGAQI
ncbi:hypothetical protein SAMN04488693_1374 [Arthrobacter subterraneus]|uniref:Uncharacterized protein n=1 Tax=Arthrobacter subterraneus TaxID=335973 RepID=A0A1G8PRW6_9MICC|nr:hypothetical protein SAMN04488693_1374 [Arthrobacter subterraneus]